MATGAARFTDLPAWQACDAYRLAVARVCEQPPLAQDWARRGQVEDSVRGPGAHLAEGFARSGPADFARFVVMARASLLESQHHLLDLEDRGYISGPQRLALNGLAEAALREVTGLLASLRSPGAVRRGS